MADDVQRAQKSACAVRDDFSVSQSAHSPPRYSRPGSCTHRFIVGLRAEGALVSVAPWVVLLPVSVMPSLRRKDQVATLAGPVAFRLVRRHVLVGWDEAIAQVAELAPVRARVRPVSATGFHAPKGLIAGCSHAGSPGQYPSN